MTTKPNFRTVSELPMLKSKRLPAGGKFLVMLLVLGGADLLRRLMGRPVPASQDEDSFVLVIRATILWVLVDLSDTLEQILDEIRKR